MKREHFIFTIGYQGGCALVDGRSLKKFGGLSTRELVDQGLYRAALRSALYTEDQDGIEYIRLEYNKKSARQYETAEDIKRLLGVYELTPEISKVQVLS